MFERFLLILLMLIPFYTLDGQGSRLTDSLELIKIYDSWEGEIKSNWKPELPMDDWDNLYLKENRVKTIIINDSEGPLWDFDLPFLEVIMMNNNMINSELPNFKNIPKLRILAIRNSNGLENKELPDFENLEFLASLELENNNLIGEIPRFENCTDLTFINLADNKLTGNIPSVNHLTELHHLLLNNNALSDTIPTFANNHHLFLVSFSNNNLSGAIPEFSDSIELISMGFLNNNLSGCFPDQLRNSIDTTNFGAFDVLMNNLFAFAGNSLLPWEGDFQKYYRYEDQIGAPCDDGNDQTLNDTIDINCICGLDDVVLSLDHINLSLQKSEENSFSLHWTYQHIKDLEYFEVEEGSNENNFSNIQVVSPEEGMNGSFILPLTTLRSGDIYYRVVAINHQGHKIYSNIVSVYIENKSSVILYPNPTFDFIYLKEYLRGANEIKLFNQLGQIVYRNNKYVDKIDLRNLESGIYHILIDNNYSEKFIKLE